MSITWNMKTSNTTGVIRLWQFGKRQEAKEAPTEWQVRTVVAINPRRSMEMSYIAMEKRTELKYRDPVEDHGHNWGNLHALRNSERYNCGKLHKMIIIYELDRIISE